MLAPGDLLPNPELLSGEGKSVRLHDCFGDSALVIYFYPKDHTFGCTIESCDFRDQYQAFLAQGAQVVGISRDDVRSHQSFIRQHGLPFPLLSDAQGTAHRLFGVKKVLGVLPARVTFVALRPGVVRHVYQSELAFRAHATDALNALKRLKSPAI
ncbi:MAG TPA: peroxiredoxin [Polyangiaceae bacterium]|nr:peroxiredoxin [Polyangiaceae bacterium]